jgi:Uma2 family endonuclease
MVQLLSPPSQDQRIIHHNRSWAQFKLIEQGFEGSTGVRLSYYAGTIEIIMPGKEHEAFKSLIGQLIELFFLKRCIVYKATGSMTQEKAGQASAQADESYCIGSDKAIPDLAIEVVYTSGNVNKLAQYQALGVPEVWFWEDGVLRLYHLATGGYQLVDRSQIPALADLDVKLMERCILKGETSHLEAAQEWFSCNRYC